jgi:hypothetical protein
MTAFSEHRRRPRRKTRQPIGVRIAKAKPAKAKIVLAAIFRGWDKDTPKALAERVNEIRRSADQRLLSIAEWKQYEAMCKRIQSSDLRNQLKAPAVPTDVA